MRKKKIRFGGGEGTQMEVRRVQICIMQFADMSQIGRAHV